ncbi:MAG: efflux RND transporter permease subunit, partial [Isosphaeraceae bacterium]
MTSFSFILGIVPLVRARGAGAASRRALGTAVFGGMLAATILAVFFVPVFYVVMQRLSEWRHKPTAENPEPLKLPEPPKPPEPTEPPVPPETTTVVTD